MFQIRLNKDEKSLALKRVQSDVRLVQNKVSLSLKQVGRAGAKGATGEGIAAGGTTGQVLAKKTNADYDTQWVNQSGGGGGGAVNSVNGQTGTVVIGKSDVGLGNADNTSDLNKPISTATQLALDNKEPSFTKGSVVAGNNITMSGALTDRLVGSGNITISAVTAPSFPDINTFKRYGDTERDWCIPGLMILSDTTTGTVSTNRMVFEKYLLPTAQSFDRIGFEVTSPAATGKVLRVGVATLDNNNQPSELVADLGTFAVDSTGWVEKTIDVTLPVGNYVGLWVCDASPTFRYVRAYSPFANALAGNATAAPMRNEASMAGGSIVGDGFPAEMPTDNVKIERDIWRSSAGLLFLLRWRQKAS